MRACPGRRHQSLHRALATALHRGVRRLHEDREIRRDPVGLLPRNAGQPVAFGLDLFALVEDVRHVAGGHRYGRREPQADRDAALHVARAEPVEDPAVEPGRQVARDRHGVEVPGDHDPLRVAERAARNDGVTEAVHLQVRQRAQRVLHRGRDLALVPAHRLDIDERGRQRHRVLPEVERSSEGYGHAGTVPA